jgi:hypothetical protein
MDAGHFLVFLFSLALLPFLGPDPLLLPLPAPFALFCHAKSVAWTNRVISPGNYNVSRFYNLQDYKITRKKAFSQEV